MNAFKERDHKIDKSIREKTGSLLIFKVNVIYFVSFIFMWNKKKTNTNKSMEIIL